MFNRLSIRVKLLIITILASMLPVATVALIVGLYLSNAITSIRAEVQETQDRMANEVIGAYVKNEADVTARRVDASVIERVKDVSNWAIDPILLQAARDASAQAIINGLYGISEEDLEMKMEEDRALMPGSTIETYLKTIINNNPAFSEMFFTDDHGFTVAGSNKTSDFVQKGETWWETAWTTGSYIGPVEYDESAGVFATEIDVRMDDKNGRPLGVIKAVVNINALQDRASEAAARLPGSTVRIFNRDGFLIADTQSRNSPDIIMQGAGNVLNRDWTAARQLIQQSQLSGFLLGEQSIDQTPIVIGYAHTADGAAYNLPGFDGFDWIITVEQPTQIAMAPLEGLQDVISGLENARRSMILMFLGVSLAAVVLGGLFSYLIARNIVQPIKALAVLGERFSSGDMNVEIEVRHEDEIGVLEKAFQRMVIQLRQMLQNERGEREYMEQTVQRYLAFMQQVGSGKLKARLVLDGQNRAADDPLLRLGRDLNQMTDNLHRTILQVREASNNLASAAAEILAATTQQASGASEQSAAISQTTVTVEEVKAIAEQSSLRAQEVASTSQRTVDVSRTGSQAVNDTIASMNQIRDQVDDIAENILALSEQTQQVGEIIATVNEIASQSNMLALNASVEAARAGEAGKGFSVVASEVRSLAEQSRQATTQVKNILSEIQKATNATVMAIEEGSKGVDRGVVLASQADQSIQQLSGVITESAQTAVQVVAAGQQQVTGVDQVAMAIRNINQAMIQSLASTRQAEKAAQNLSALAHRLSETVNRYEV